MKNKNDIVVNDELIARYLSGEATPDEAEALIDWLAEPGNQEHFEEMQATWDVTYPSKAKVTFNKDVAWDGMELTMKTTSTGVPIAFLVQDRRWFDHWSFGKLIGLLRLSKKQCSYQISQSLQKRTWRL